MIICSKCGAENGEADGFCGACAAYLWEPEKVSVEAETGEAEADAPGAVLPGTPLPPPRPKPQSLEIPPEHGDLICGECGAGNIPTRKFCRSCGSALADARVVKLRWWTRAWRPLHRRRRAGDRPRRWSGRRTRWRRRAVVLVVLAVIAGLLWNFRSGIHDNAVGGYNAVMDRAWSTTVNPRRWSDSGGREFGAKDPFEPAGWQPLARGEGRKPWLRASFEEPFRLTYVYIQSGHRSEKIRKTQGRPQEVSITALDANENKIETKTFTLVDEPDPQRLRMSADSVSSVQVTVLKSIDGTAKVWRTTIGNITFKRRR